MTHNYAEFAFKRPFPYGLTKKMAARTVYYAQKLMVFAATESTLTAKGNAAVVETLKSVSRSAAWVAICTSAPDFIYSADKYPQVYEPDADSFLLADAALSEIKDSENIQNVLEVGCGSGIISYLIQSRTKAKVLAMDINPQAVECARMNGIDTIKSDLFQKVECKFDLILFNPPYLPDGLGESAGSGIDLALYGGPTGSEVLYRFLRDAREHIGDKGKILVVVSTYTRIDDLKSKMESLRYNVEIIDTFENLSVLRGTVACA